MTLPEVTINMLILGIVLMAFITVMSTVQRHLVREQDRSTTNDQARLAVEEVDREVRSGNVLYNPASEPAPTVANFGFRVYTQANAPTRNSGNPMCVQYRISNGNLTRRWWPSGNTGAVTAWVTMASNIVNTGSQLPFTLNPSSATGGRLLDISLYVNAKLGDARSRTILVQDSVAIRNQVTGTDPCTPVPAG